MPFYDTKCNSSACDEEEEQYHPINETHKDCKKCGSAMSQIFAGSRMGYVKGSWMKHDAFLHDHHTSYDPKNYERR